ncbi:unnamed protein product, partial [Prorocentrum cordatum]
MPGMPAAAHGMPHHGMSGRGHMMHGDVSATQEYGGPGPMPIRPPPQAPPQDNKFFCMPGFCCHKRDERVDDSAMDQPVHEYHEYASMPFHGAGTVDDVEKGSVIADLAIRPPANASAAGLQQQLAASSQDLQSAVAGSLSARAEQFKDSVVGDISVSSVDLTPHLGAAVADAGAAAAGAGAAAAGHVDSHVSNALGWAGGVAGHVHHHAKKVVDHVKNSSLLERTQDALDQTGDWAADVSQAGGGAAVGQSL